MNKPSFFDLAREAIDRLEKEYEETGGAPSAMEKALKKGIKIEYTDGTSEILKHEED